MINKLGWQGKFVIQIKNINTGKITEEIIENRIMDTVINQLSETLLGVPTDLTIGYLALGTGNTAITDTDTVLDTEIFRTAPSVVASRVSLGQIETEFIVLDTEAVATIEEIGIFVGSTASITVDTGTLLSRILWHHVKTTAEEITFKRIDKITRG